MVSVERPTTTYDCERSLSLMFVPTNTHETLPLTPQTASPLPFAAAKLALRKMRSWSSIDLSVKGSALSSPEAASDQDRGERSMMTARSEAELVAVIRKQR